MSNTRALFESFQENLNQTENDNSEKIANLKMMDKVIRSLNDEEYLYGSWLSYGVPDEETEDGYEDDAEDYERIENVFKDILRSVVENNDELFNPSEEVLAFARKYEPEIKVLEESKQVLGEDSYETAEEVKAGVEKSGGLYQFIYDEWHNLPEEMKREIALNAVYELNNDAKVLEDLAERL